MMQKPVFFLYWFIGNDYLYSGADVNLPDDSGMTPIEIAADRDSLEVMSSLIYRLQRRTKKTAQSVPTKKETKKSKVR